MKLRPILESYNSFHPEINSAQYRHLFLFYLLLIDRILHQQIFLIV
jgi:hypothetical protein